MIALFMPYRPIVVTFCAYFGMPDDERGGYFYIGVFVSHKNNNQFEDTKDRKCLLGDDCLIDIYI